MKIFFFDWMHRKLHPVVAKYSQVPPRKDEEDVKIKEMVAEEKEALLLHDMLHGILTIGTLGQLEDPFLLDPSYDIEEPEKEQREEVALVKEAAPVVKPVQLVNRKEKGQEEKDPKVETTLVKIEPKLLREDWPLLREDKERMERKRMTLADLFAADPMMTKEEHEINKGSKISGVKQLHEVKKKKTSDTTIKSCTNNNSSSNNNTKKKNKLQKLTTRMLKKKIHPESINMAGEADVHSSCLVYW